MPFCCLESLWPGIWVPLTGHVTITKIENLHIVTARKILWFQKCYSFRSMTKNNEVIAEKPFQNSGVTKRCPCGIDARRQYILLVCVHWRQTDVSMLMYLRYQAYKAVTQNPCWKNVSRCFTTISTLKLTFSMPARNGTHPSAAGNCSFIISNCFYATTETVISTNCDTKLHPARLVLGWAPSRYVTKVISHLSILTRSVKSSRRYGRSLEGDTEYVLTAGLCLTLHLVRAQWNPTRFMIK